MIKRLNEPYPLITSHKLRLCVVVSLFVFLFLYVFRPFRMDGELPLGQAVIAGYGLITFAVMCFQFMLLPMLFSKTFTEERWTLLKALLYAFSTILLIAAANFIYSVWLGFFHFRFLHFLNVTGMTMAIGIFPTTGVMLFTQALMAKKHTSGSEQMNRELATAAHTHEVLATPVFLDLPDEEGRIVITLPASDLVCMVAEDNYVEVFYRSGTLLEKLLVRNSLKNMEQHVARSPLFFRCHRSYLVNMGCIASVEGNAQGYRLKLLLMNELVPVSRARSAEFREWMARQSATKA